MDHLQRIVHHMGTAAPEFAFDTQRKDLGYIDRSPDGRLLMARGINTPTCLYDTSSGREVATLPKTTSADTAFAWGAGSSMIVELREFDCTTGVGLSADDTTLIVADCAGGLSSCPLADTDRAPIAAFRG